MGSYDSCQPFAGGLWFPSTACYLFRQMLVRSFGRCICTDQGLVLCCQVNHTRFSRRRLGGLPKFLENPCESVPRASDSGGS